MVDGRGGTYDRSTLGHGDGSLNVEELELLALFKEYVVDAGVTSTRSRRPRNTTPKESLVIPSGSCGAKESESTVRRMPPSPATRAIQVPANEAT